MSIKTVLIAASVMSLSLFAPLGQALADDSGKADLANNVHEWTYHFWEAMCVDKLMNFNLNAAGWARFNEPHGRGIDVTQRCAHYMRDYCVKNGMQDAEAVESANNSDREANKPRAAALVDEMKSKVSFTLDAPPTLKFDNTEWDLTHRYMMTVIGEFQDDRFKPKGGAAFLTMVLSTTAKDISVSLNPDGKHFTITCPVETEPGEWDSKIVKGMLRGCK